MVIAQEYPLAGAEALIDKNKGPIHEIDVGCARRDWPFSVLRASGDEAG